MTAEKIVFPNIGITTFLVQSIWVATHIDSTGQYSKKSSKLRHTMLNTIS